MIIKCIHLVKLDVIKNSLTDIKEYYNKSHYSR